MKKIIFLIFSIIFAIGVLVASLFIIDSDVPEITINSKPYLACNIDEDSLMDYITVKDDNLKTVFIEEKELMKIAETGKITYVAIDENNNITKKQINVDVDSNINDFYIEAINDLNLQINTQLIPSNYFSLKNKCGWQVDDTLCVKGIPNNPTIGDYEVVVSARKHKVEDLNATFKIDDFLAPKIVLSSDTIESYAERYYDDDFFLNYVDHVEDDNDNPQDLISDIETNWREIINPSENGWVSKSGTYSITYYVSDKDDNTGKATMKVILNENIPEPEVEIMEEQ